MDMNIRIKIAAVSTLTLWFFLFTPLLFLAHAQIVESNCVQTVISVPPPGSPGCGTGTTGPCGAVVDFAQQINDNLDPTNRLNKEISSNCGKSTPRGTWVDGIYWCAYTVVDSYNLAGIKGLSGAGVIGIHDQMTGNPAFEFLDYRTDKQGVMQKLKPGYAFFIEGTFGEHRDGQQHTGIIKTVTIDERGNGTIVTLESNGGSKSRTLTVANWIVDHRDNRPLVAFGGSK